MDGSLYVDISQFFTKNINTSIDSAVLFQANINQK